MTVPAINPNDPDILKQAAAALGELKSKDPENATRVEKYLAALQNHKIVALATDQAFALRDSTGEIRAFKQVLRLSEANGGLIRPLGDKGPWVISAQGYEKWSEASGTCVLFPQTVNIFGNPFPNPYPIAVNRDGYLVFGEKAKADGMRIVQVYARAIAFRFSDKGLPMAKDWTTFYDVKTQRMIDLLAKAKRCPQAFQLLPSEMRPEKDGTWAKYDFDEAANFWVNTQHPEAFDWFGQIYNRERKALDFAQTFAARNAAKHLSGLQKAPGNVWDIEVTCWRPINGSMLKWDPTMYAEVQQRVEGLGRGSQPALPEAGNSGMVIDLQTGSEDVEPATLVAEDEEAEPREAPAPEPTYDVDPETGEVDGQDAGPASAPGSFPDEDQAPAEDSSGSEDSKESGVQAQLRVALQEFDTDIIKRAKARAKVNHLPPFSDKEAADIMAALNSILNAGS